MKPKLACVAAEQQREKSLLQQVGLDLEHLKDMGLQTMDALAAELKANPELRNRAAALLEKNPDLKARAEADFVTMERESGNLFDRADSRCLLLPDEELEPWMPKMVQAIERLQADTPGLTLETPPTAEIADRFFDALLPVLREMAQAIFTPERLRNPRQTCPPAAGDDNGSDNRSRPCPWANRSWCGEIPCRHPSTYNRAWRHSRPEPP